MGFKTTISDMLLEPVLIVGSESEYNTPELKELLSNAGIKLVEPVGEPTRGMSIASVQKGGKKSLSVAIKHSPILNRQERKMLIKELKQITG